MVTEQKCIDALQQAADELGRGFSRPDYEAAGFSPHPSTIYRKLGGWNQAKQAAGLKRNAVGNKKTVNSAYFRTLDPESAYWLGFLYGDGSIFHDNGWKLSVGVQLSDAHHLRSFRDALDSAHTITDGDPASLQIRDLEITEDLRGHGLTDEKTTSDALPDINSDRCRSAFVRGLFDADGHIGQRGRFNITGSSEERFQTLSSWLPTQATTVDRGDGCYTLRVGGIDRLMELYPWVYPKGIKTQPKLDRKHDTWEKTKEK